jgi:hypothetical protein
LASPHVRAHNFPAFDASFLVSAPFPGLHTLV